MKKDDIKTTLQVGPIQGPTIRSRFNFKLKKSDMEKGGGISMTVPEDSYTIKELVDRYERGEAIPVARISLYDEVDNREPDFDDEDSNQFLSDDITDQYEKMQNNREKVAALKSDLNNWEKEKAAKKKAAEEEAAKETMKKTTIKKKPPED